VLVVVGSVDWVVGGRLTSVRWWCDCNREAELWGGFLGLGGFWSSSEDEDEAMLLSSSSWWVGVR